MKERVTSETNMHWPSDYIEVALPGTLLVLKEVGALKNINPKLLAPNSLIERDSIRMVSECKWNRRFREEAVCFCKYLSGNILSSEKDC